VFRTIAPFLWLAIFQPENAGGCVWRVMLSRPPAAELPSLLLHNPGGVCFVFSCVLPASAKFT
jgi:hypothetical protein